MESFGADEDTGRLLGLIAMLSADFRSLRAFFHAGVTTDELEGRGLDGTDAEGWLCAADEGLFPANEGLCPAVEGLCAAGEGLCAAAEGTGLTLAKLGVLDAAFDEALEETDDWSEAGGFLKLNGLFFALLLSVTVDGLFGTGFNLAFDDEPDWELNMFTKS